MPIDWTKVDEGLEKIAQGRAVRKKIEECQQLGHVRVDENPNLNIPFTTAVQNLYDNRADTLIAEGQALIRDART